MNAYLSLLSQALARYTVAVQRGDLLTAEKHRKIYLSLFPLAFAGVMLNHCNGGTAHK
jgi:hypothetical protein